MENYRQALVSSTLPQIWSFHIHVSEMYQNVKRMSDQYSVLSNRVRFPQYDLVTLNRLFCGVLVPCLSALVLYQDKILATSIYHELQYLYVIKSLLTRPQALGFHGNDRFRYRVVTVLEKQRNQKIVSH